MPFDEHKVRWGGIPSDLRRCVGSPPGSVVGARCNTPVDPDDDFGFCEECAEQLRRGQ